MQDIERRFSALFTAEPDPSKDYYALSLWVMPNGRMERSCQTSWVGFTDDDPPREIREASLVQADKMLQHWREIGEPGMVVESVDAMAMFLGCGGHAVVEMTVAQRIVSFWLRPKVFVRTDESGFISPSLLGNAAFNRAPTAKHRMKILQRDAYRCRICGRSPRDHVDIELHVHHILPWALGGLTVDENLLTLCHTCHNGLDPHFTQTLFRFLPRQTIPDASGDYMQRLDAYRQRILGVSANAAGADPGRCSAPPSAAQ